MSDPTSNAALAEKYGAIAYDSRPLPLSHPRHLATVAKLFGAAPAATGTCRVLEVGSNNGANLIPMAAALPDARFVGCDLAAAATEAGREMIGDLGLRNVRLFHDDLRALPETLGAFDYIIAHGVYSWVPAAVRDALFALAAHRLAPNGVMYVSYNTYPGCHMRQAAWDILHFHTDTIADPRTRLGAAREISALLADEGATEVDTDALLRGEFRQLAGRPDSLLFHDDLALPNDPVYFHQFAAHAARHGLAFVAEAQPWMMSTAGLAPGMRQFVAGLDRLRREQYLDFARFRRIRHSVLCRADHRQRFELTTTAVTEMHVAAPMALVRAINEGRLPAADAGDGGIRTLLDRLADAAPAALSFATVANLLQRSGVTTRPVESMLADAWVAGNVELQADPIAVASTPTDRPVASPVARWQARREGSLTTLRHESARLQDPGARHLLWLLDGTRDITQLEAAMASMLSGHERAAVHRFVADYLRIFARQALLLPAA